MDDEIRVIVIATGFDEKMQAVKGKAAETKPSRACSAANARSKARRGKRAEPKKEPEEDPFTKILEIFNSK
jgi:cell division GTPase FtsZ